MIVEIICPCCNKKLLVTLPVSDIAKKNDFNYDQAILEQELLKKHNILLG
nr:hypothetical protein [Clostridium sp. 12(A)]